MFVRRAVLVVSHTRQRVTNSSGPQFCHCSFSSETRDDASQSRCPIYSFLIRNLFLLLVLNDKKWMVKSCKTKLLRKTHLRFAYEQNVCLNQARSMKFVMYTDELYWTWSMPQKKVSRVRRVAERENWVCLQKSSSRRSLFTYSGTRGRWEPRLEGRRKI